MTKDNSGRENREEIMVGFKMLLLNKAINLFIIGIRDVTPTINITLDIDSDADKVSTLSCSVAIPLTKKEAKI
jgi:hypothetical protein